MNREEVREHHFRCRGFCWLASMNTGPGFSSLSEWGPQNRCIVCIQRNRDGMDWRTMLQYIGNEIEKYLAQATGVPATPKFIAHAQGDLSIRIGGTDFLYDLCSQQPHIGWPHIQFHAETCMGEVEHAIHQLADTSGAVKNAGCDTYASGIESDSAHQSFAANAYGIQGHAYEVVLRLPQYL